MKKIYIVVLILFIILAIVFYRFKTKEIINYELQGKTYNLLIADVETEWEKGLMDVKKLKNAHGMLFIFPDKKSRTFWNKNTLVDLDIYWIVNDKVVGKDFLPSIEKSKEYVYVSSPVPVDKVAELIRE